MAKRAFPPWYCHGCKKFHPVSVWIEGETCGQYWCLRSMRKGLKDRRNDLPRAAYLLPEALSQHGRQPRLI